MAAVREEATVAEMAEVIDGDGKEMVTAVAMMAATAVVTEVVRAEVMKVVTAAARAEARAVVRAEARVVTARRWRRWTRERETRTEKIERGFPHWDSNPGRPGESGLS